MKNTKDKTIRLYNVGQKFRNPRNGEIFEIINREILEETKVTIYKIHNAKHNASIERDGIELHKFIVAGIEAL